MTAITYYRDDVRVVRKNRDANVSTPDVLVEQRVNDEWITYDTYNSADNSPNIPDAVERARMSAQALCKKLHKKSM